MIYLINYLLHQSNQELGVVWLYCNYFHVKRQVCYYYVYYVINNNCHFDWNLFSNLNKLIYNKLSLQISKKKLNRLLFFNYKK